MATVIKKVIRTPTGYGPTVWETDRRACQDPPQPPSLQFQVELGLQFLAGWTSATRCAPQRARRPTHCAFPCLILPA
ncbi:hypothetical protein HAX54_042185 [Datura stramonium]|uniref:Uncharacterized protein n=1 Tax=Datura stramonium TaxID=4076 RepID=A0ABS8SLZ4_DATST|nr:hypothetical protein [Datura stramonium]